MKKSLYILCFLFFMGLSLCKNQDTFSWGYSTESPSTKYSYNIKKLNGNFQVVIFENKEFSYVDPEIYRMRDRFYITWDIEKDILWIYSSDVGTYFIYFENGWIKRELRYYNYVVRDGSRPPQMIIELVR